MPRLSEILGAVQSQGGSALEPSIRFFILGTRRTGLSRTPDLFIFTKTCGFPVYVLPRLRHLYNSVRLFTHHSITHKKWLLPRATPLLVVSTFFIVSSSPFVSAVVASVAYCFHCGWRRSEGEVVNGELLWAESNQEALRMTAVRGDCSEIVDSWEQWCRRSADSTDVGPDSVG